MMTRRQSHRQDEGSDDSDSNNQNRRRSKRNQRVIESTEEIKNASFDEEDYSEEDAEMEEEQINTRKRRGRQVGLYREDSESDKELEEERKRKKKRNDEINRRGDPRDNFTIIDKVNQVDEQYFCRICRKIDRTLMIMKGGSEGAEYILHQECVEKNQISYLKNQVQYFNVEKAIKDAENAPRICTRCHQIGASIKCCNEECSKWYHGHLCAELCMIPASNSEQEYVCLHCTNEDNFNNLRRPEELPEKSYQHAKGRMKRDHFQLPYSRVDSSFQPQEGDIVYYFFQGHELLLHEYSCFFYAGDQKTPSQEKPWEEDDRLKMPTPCEIVKIDYVFPSMQAVILLQRFS